MPATRIQAVYRQGNEDPLFCTTTPELAEECCTLLNAEAKEAGWTGAYGPHSYGGLDLIDNLENMDWII